MWPIDSPHNLSEFVVEDFTTFDFISPILGKLNKDSKNAVDNFILQYGVHFLSLLLMLY